MRNDLINNYTCSGVSLTQNEIETVLVVQMLNYIERRISFERLVGLSEEMRRRYATHASEDVVEVLNKLHDLQEKLKNSAEKKMCEDEIILRVDEFILLLIREVPSI